MRRRRTSGNRSVYGSLRNVGARLYVSSTITSMRRYICTRRADTDVAVSPNSTWSVTSRHDTTGYLVHAFGTEKSWPAVSCVLGRTARNARHDKRDTHDTQQRTQLWLVHYVKIITLLLSPKNVIYAVQGEGNLYQIGNLRRKMTIKWQWACSGITPTPTTCHACRDVT